MVVEQQLELIYHYFPDLDEKQKKQFARLYPLYKDWNQKINVISRKDIDNLYLHHVLHSLACANVFPFKPDARILDLGTGGGFPGIPLAILFPETHFHLIDGRAKKLKVVQSVSDKIGLANVRTTHTRIEDMKGKKYDFVTSRAVTDLKQMLLWSRPLISPEMKHAYPNGLLSYTGGNIDQKLKELPGDEYSEVFPISDTFKEDYFAEKYLVYMQA